MSSRGSPSSLARGLLWITRLALLFLFITLASTTPISDLSQAHPSRPNPKAELLYAPVQEDGGKSLAKRDCDSDIYATGWRIGPDTTENNIYGFGPSADGLPSGIVQTGQELGEGTSGTKIFEASLVTFDKPRAVGTDTKSREWGGRPIGDDHVQPDLAVKFSDQIHPYDAAPLLEKLQASKFVPSLYKALKLKLTDCFNYPLDGSLVVTERLAKTAETMLEEYDTKPFNRLIMMQQSARGLADAHQLGIAHGDVTLGNLMKTLRPDDWRVIDWDLAEDIGRTPVKGKDDAFALDVKLFGKSLVYAAFPLLPANPKKMEKLAPLLRAYPPLDPASLRQQLGNVLESVPGSKGHGELLTIVSKTNCKPSMRLTMEEVYQELRDFPECDLPLFQ